MEEVRGMLQGPGLCPRHHKQKKGMTLEGLPTSVSACRGQAGETVPGSKPQGCPAHVFPVGQRPANPRLLRCPPAPRVHSTGHFLFTGLSSCKSNAGRKALIYPAFTA